MLQGYAVLNTGTVGVVMDVSIFSLLANISGAKLYFRLPSAATTDSNHLINNDIVVHHF